MTGEEMERAIQLLIEHHAKVRTDIEDLKEAQKITTANIDSLARQAEADRREVRETIGGLFEQMCEGFDKFILSNEVTGDLAKRVASLAVTTQRITNIEETLR